MEKMEWFLALRYLRPRRTFVSVITVLSVLGVTLGVMVLIVVLSVMEGFEQELRNKIIGFNAPLTLTSGDLIREPEPLMIRLRREPEVLAVTPFARGPVLVKFAGRISTPVIKGIDPVTEDDVTPIKRYLIAGEFELRGNTVIIGQEWARRNGAFVGDKILIYAPRHFEPMLQNKKTDPASILPDEMLVTGIFQTGLFDYDVNFILTSLENAQRLYTLGDMVHGLAIKLQPGFDAPGVIKKIQKRWHHDYPPPLQTQSWMEQNAPLFNAIATERVAMTFILFFIMIVAAFGLCSTLITITVQKSREIGLLKALGASDQQVMTIFVLHGLIVGILGATSGVGLAVVVLHYRNPFRNFLLQTFQVDVFSADIYNFPSIPASTDYHLVMLIALAAVIICVLAAFIPAWGASRLAPARALRYE